MADEGCRDAPASSDVEAGGSLTRTRQEEPSRPSSATRRERCPCVLLTPMLCGHTFPAYHTVQL